MSETLKPSRAQQEAVLWLMVLDQLAWTLEDRYGLVPNETQRYIHDQLIGARIALQHRAGRERRAQPTPVLFRQSPFDYVRRLARELARKANKRVPNERQLNSRFVEDGHYPVRSVRSIEPMVEILLGRLVSLAAYLAERESVDPYQLLNDLDHDRPIPIRWERLVLVLFWEGLVEGVRSELEAWIRADEPEQGRFPSLSLVDLLLKIVDYREWWKRVGHADEPFLWIRPPSVNQLPN